MSGGELSGSISLIHSAPQLVAKFKSIVMCGQKYAIVFRGQPQYL